MTVTTICGCVEVWRKRWMSAIGAVCQVPLDSWLGVAEGVIATGVMSLVCLLHRGATSFEQAAECLPAATNIRLGKETLRQLCIESGKAMPQVIAKGELTPDWTAKECLTPSPACGSERPCVCIRKVGRGRNSPRRHGEIQSFQIGLF